MEQPLEASGVVIIDEIDLHLHPSWQQNIISNLTKAFRNVQFIVTTHSPFVVSSTEPTENNQVLTLTDGNIEPATEDDYGAEVQDVLLNTFKLDTLRNKEVQGHIDHLWRIISSVGYDESEANREIAWLRNHLSENDKEFVKIKLQMALIKKKEAGHDAHK
jgi:predicted ATP-binding protein involved in virulence